MNISDLDNNLLFKYSYNNKVFCGYHQNGNIYMIALYKNYIISKFSNDEIYVMRKVINSLRVDRDKSIVVNTLNIQGKNYDIFYDSEKCLYFWDSENTAQEIIINQALNFRYNNIKDYVCFDFWKMLQKDLIKDQKHFKRKVLIEKLSKTITVLVPATISLTLFLSLSTIVYKTIDIAEDANSQTSGVVIESIVEGSEEKNSIGEYAENSKDSLEDSEVYSWDEIKLIIDNNPNLCDEDKKMIKKLRFVFDEYNQYMDLELIKSRLSDLKIVHIKKSESQLKDENAAGCYWEDENTIELYNDESNANKYLVFIHEFGHVLQKKNYDGNTNIYLELSDTFFSVEVLLKLIENNEIDTDFEFGKDLGGYDVLLKYYFYLANLMPIEARCKFQFDPSIQYFAKSVSSNTKEYGYIFTISDLLYDLKETENSEDYHEIEEKIMERIDSIYMSRLGINTKDDIDSCIMTGALYEKQEREYLKDMKARICEFILNYDDNKPSWFGTGKYDQIYLGHFIIKKMFEENYNSKVSYALIKTGEAMAIDFDDYDMIYEFNDTSRDEYTEWTKMNYGIEIPTKESHEYNNFDEKSER